MNTFLLCVRWKIKFDGSYDCTTHLCGRFNKLWSWFNKFPCICRCLSCWIWIYFFLVILHRMMKIKVDITCPHEIKMSRCHWIFGLNHENTEKSLEFTLAHDVRIKSSSLQIDCNLFKHDFFPIRNTLRIAI